MIKDSGLKARAIFLGALVLLASGQAVAAGITLQDDTVWLHDNQEKTVNGEVQCQNGNSVSSLQIVFPDGSSTTADQNIESGESFSYDLQNSNPEGEYEAVLECQGGNTDSQKFSVLQLHVSRISPTQEISRFRGEKISADIKAKVNGSSGDQFSLQDADFSMRLTGASTDLLNVNEIDSSQGANIYRIEGEIPGNVEPGFEFLESSVSYSPDSVDGSINKNIEGFSVQIQKPWNFDITNRTPENSIINYENSHRISIETQITHKGEPENSLSSSDFYLIVKDAEGDVVDDLNEKEWILSDLQNTDGEYRLTLSNIPSLEIGKYNWFIGLDEDDGKEIVELPVYNYMFLSGDIHDAQGKGVNSEILVESESTVTKQLNVDDGTYRGRVLPGNYNFTVNFPELTSSFQNVQLREGVRGTIRYDEIPQGDVEGVLDGVSVVNAVGVVFGYPLGGEAYMDMSYDPSQVSFDNAQIVECKRWNIVKRNCWGEWSSLNESEVTIYPTVGRAEFTGEPVNVSEGREKLMSAYMIVRNTRLTPENIDMEMGRSEIGSSQSIDGKIETPSGEGVGGVNVEVSIVEGENVMETVTAQTNSNGNFGTQINLPEEAGIYTVNVEARKDPYQGFQTTLSGNVETFIRKSVSIDVPEDVEFYPGESSQTSFTVVNDGQTDITDTKLRINGLKNTWYEFDQASWSSIEPGGSREAVMTVELPSDYCGQQCTEYPTFNAEVVATSDGESLNDLESVQSVVTKERSGNSSESSEAQDSENQGSSFSMPDVEGATGKFLEQRSSLNIALGLATVFILALAVSVKKKKESDSDRNNRMNGNSSRPVQGSSSRSISKPDVGSREESEEEQETEHDKDDAQAIEEEQKQDQNEGSVENSDNGSHKCSVCGEQFDTESALELHEQAMH